MKPVFRLLGLILLVDVLSACRDRAPEKPTSPPTPTTLSTSAAPAQSPTFASRIHTGGSESEYRAYFDGERLAHIEETHATGPLQARYEYEGARLIRYSASHAGEAGAIELVLDTQGRVTSATDAGQPLAQARIEQIRTRGQLLRSHALAEHASRSHRAY